MSIIDTSSMIIRDPWLQGFSYDELWPGATAYYTKTITEQDVCSFVGIMGDMDPAHVNPTGQEGMILPKQIAPLAAGLISATLGTKMPGQGCLYLSQYTKFVRTVCLGDTLTVQLKVIEKNGEKRRVKIKTEVYNQKDELVVVGLAELLPKG